MGLFPYTLCTVQLTCGPQMQPGIPKCLHKAWPLASSLGSEPCLSSEWIIEVEAGPPPGGIQSLSLYCASWLHQLVSLVANHLQWQENILEIPLFPNNNNKQHYSSPSAEATTRTSSLSESVPPRSWATLRSPTLTRPCLFWAVG